MAIHRFAVGDKVWPVGVIPGLSGYGSLNSITLSEEGAFKAPSEIVGVIGHDQYRLRLPSGYELLVYDRELTTRAP